MNLFVFLATFLAVFQAGHSLDCYKCNGCETASTLKETCRNVDPLTQTSACLTQIVRTGGTADSLIVKKCVVHGKNDDYLCTTLPSGETVACNICHQDFCNTATKATTNFYLCLSVLLMFFLPKFLCH